MTSSHAHPVITPDQSDGGFHLHQVEDGLIISQPIRMNQGSDMFRRNWGVPWHWSWNAGWWFWKLRWAHNTFLLCISNVILISNLISNNHNYEQNVQLGIECNQFRQPEIQNYSWNCSWKGNWFEVLQSSKSVHYWWSYILFATKCKGLTSMQEPLSYRRDISFVVISCVPWTMQRGAQPHCIIPHSPANVVNYLEQYLGFFFFKGCVSLVLQNGDTPEFQITVHACLFIMIFMPVYSHSIWVYSLNQICVWCQPTPLFGLAVCLTPRE